MFQTEALSFSDWLWLLSLTSMVLWVDEGRKAFFPTRGAALNDTASRYSRLLESDGDAEEGRAGAKSPAEAVHASVKRRSSDAGKDVMLPSSVQATPAGRFRQ